MKIKKILVLIVLTMLFCTTAIFAADPQITIQGDSTSKTNETKVLTVKITSDVEVGVVSGKIERNEKIASMRVTEKNGWKLTYNEGTGVFNIYKAEGAKDEEIIDIEYTTTSTEGTGKIILSNIKMTTITYETKDVANIEKAITIENAAGETPNPGNPGETPNPGNPGETPNPGNPDEQPNGDPMPTEVILTGIKVTKAAKKTTYKAGEKFDKTGMVIEATYSDGTSKEVTNYTITNGDKLEKGQTSVTISYTEKNITKTTTQTIKVEAEDKKTEEMSYTGVEDFMIPLILVIGIIAGVTLIKYNKYKGI